MDGVGSPSVGKLGGGKGAGRQVGEVGEVGG